MFGPKKRSHALLSHQLRLKDPSFISRHSLLFTILLVLLNKCFALWPFSASSSGSSNPDTDNLILVMGLPFSGSMSLHNYFECNSVLSSHYCCGKSQRTQFPCNDEPSCGHCVYANLNASRPAFENCGTFQVFSQFDVESGDPFAWFLPQHFVLPLLYKYSPNATWILNARESSDRWADHILHWFSVTNRLLNSFGMDYYDDTFPLAMTAGLSYGTTNQRLYQELDLGMERASDASLHAKRRVKLQTIYQQHIDKIREFARRHDTISLIEMNVDDSMAGDVLSQAFSDTQSSCWSFDGKEYENDWKNFKSRV